MKVKAIFCGKDGSLGYKHGLAYMLYLERKPSGELKMFDVNHHCASSYYGSTESFLRNWMLGRKVLIEKKGNLGLKI